MYSFTSFDLFQYAQTNKVSFFFQQVIEGVMLHILKDFYGQFQKLKELNYAIKVHYVLFKIKKSLIDSNGKDTVGQAWKNICEKEQL